MAQKIVLPKLNDLIEEVTITDWYKAVGDTIQASEKLVEIETDKVSMDIDADKDGVVLYRVELGQKVPVGGILAIVGEVGEDYEELLRGT